MPRKKTDIVEPAPPEPEQAAEEWTLIAARIWNRRKQIAGFVVLVCVITLVYVLLMPNMYTAQTTILPDVDKTRLLGMPGLSDLVASTGMSVGETPVVKLYPIMMSSARILREVIYTRYQVQRSKDSLNLVQYFGLKGPDEAVNFEAALTSLSRRMDSSFDPRLGTLILKVTMEDPKLSADVANRITQELDLYTRTKRRTSVTAQREFIEQRLREVERSLARSEDSLRIFKENNRRVLDSPRLMLEQSRLERQVEINSTIFIELKKQIEIAKIEEIKNIPIINILDQARIPVFRSSPKRTDTVILSFILSLMIAIAWVSGLSYLPVQNGIAQLKTLVAKLKSEG